jgi:hypothetical protein
MASGKHTSNPNRRNDQSMANRGRLEAGKLYEGTIGACNYQTMTYTVSLENGDTVEGARDGTGFFCGLIGIKTTHRLSPGTLVLVAYESSPWIVATAPADVPDATAYLSRTMTGKGFPAALKTSHPNDTKTIPEHNSPEDLYEGEFEMANLLGGFLRFLTFMTSLGINERNQIEFHLARDLTRLLSHNFEHFSSTGDRKIFDDGRLNEEENTTTYDHERWGALDPFSEKSPVENASMPEDFDPQVTGRWRYTRLQGFIGDFINSWITDPTAVLGRMAEEAVRSGKSRVHFGQDGTILFQSVADIILERVCRVLVPIRIKHEEDPQGVIREQMDQLDASFLKTWNQHGTTSEHHTLSQIREYVRYLNQYQSLARIHQLAAKGQEWKVPSESDTPAPQVNGMENDRESVNQGATVYWKEAYATIRIMRDGSILNLDAYGNATASSAYGIEHSSTRHYRVWAAGDIVMKAGASMFLSARRHIEIVASRGGLALKGRTFLRGLCERGTLWLKSDYDPDEPYTPEDGDPKAEAIGRQAIRIQATKGETRWLSWLKARFLIEKPAGDEDQGESLEFGSMGQVRFSASKNVEFDVGQNLLMTIREHAHWTCQNFLLRSQQFLLPGVAQFKPGNTIIRQLKAQLLEVSERIAGPLNPGLLRKPIIKGARYQPHTNHITVYKGEKPILPTDTPETSFFHFRETESAYWTLLPTEEYSWPSAQGDKGDVNRLFEPLSQQQLRLDSPAGYLVWSGGCDALLPGLQTASGSSGWPGLGVKWLRQASSTAPTLGVVTSRRPESFTPDQQTELTPGSVTFTFLSR